MKINDAIFGALFFLLGLAIVVHVQSFPTMSGQKVGPALYPGLAAAALAACGLLLVVSGLRDRKRAPWIETLPWLGSARHVGAFVAIVATTIAYVVLAERIGFLIIAPLALFTMFIAFGVRARAAAIVAVLASVVIWYAFYKLLRVPLPWGVLERFAF